MYGDVIQSKYNLKGGDYMALPKWTRKDLELMNDEGYWIVPCKDENETIEVKSLCRKYGRCAQNGRIINDEGKELFFVCTKDRGGKKGDKPTPLTELANRDMVIKND